jgi:hypothetical protein
MFRSGSLSANIATILIPSKFSLQKIAFFTIISPEYMLYSILQASFSIHFSPNLPTFADRV